MIMNYRVLKFGGSSVADATAVSRVLDIVGKESCLGTPVVISSAISGCTDALISGDPALMEIIRNRHLAIIDRFFTGEARKAAREDFLGTFSLMQETAPREDWLTFGELFSTRILYRKLACDGFNAQWLDSRKLVVKGDIPLTYKKIREAVSGSDAGVFVAPGFIASNPDGSVTTLGRGGSDYSAALYAAALGASSLEIWTDVPGIMTANPRKVSMARTVPHMSYKAALDMAEGGAKVLYAPTVAPAMEAGIDITILNTFKPDGGGTTVSGAPSGSGWTGVADRETAPGTTRLTLVGEGGDDMAAAAERVAKALKKDGMEPLSISFGGGNLFVDVVTAVSPVALESIHREFFETVPLSTVNVYIAGFGAVGKALVETIGRSAGAVAERTGKKLVIAGIANSRQYVTDLSGIAPGNAASILEEKGRAGSFTQAVLSEAPRRSVFVDCTPDNSIYLEYEALLEKGINIVSSNRRSFAVPFVKYAAMHNAARRSGVFLRYETTVGAALPVMESIARSANSCEEITSIEAVVSCTLNRIFSQYDGTGTFASMVRKACKDGLTEPDPRIDLEGRDALRKLLILAREAGVPLEEGDVTIDPVVPGDLSSLSLEEFYRHLESMEGLFAEEYRTSAAKGCRRRFVAGLQKDGDSFRAWIGMRDVDGKHPAYHLRGTENAIIVRSAFHPYPLVIAGAGEGARQAASSLLNDILK